MARNLRSTLALTVAFGALAVACSGPSFRSVDAVPSPKVNKVLADVISPGLDRNYVFGRERPPVGFQPGSTSLVDVLKGGGGLHVAALLSTTGSAAVLLIEDDPAAKWGAHLLPAERTVFERFAQDASLGKWLIMITDVIVPGPKDPIPLTAYQWSRAEVEQYVACGIPEPGKQNDCSSKFFRIADVVILKKTAGAPRGQ
jgi:hypothetical protein